MPLLRRAYELWDQLGKESGTVRQSPSFVRRSRFARNSTCLCLSQPKVEVGAPAGASCEAVFQVLELHAAGMLRFRVSNNRNPKSK